MKKILLFVILIISVTILYFYKNSKLENFIKNIEKDKLEITEYYVYGTHLNFKGTLKDDMNSSNTKLVLKNSNEEIEYDIIINDSTFTLSDKINEGINLEKINDSYYILIKVSNDKDIKYYSFSNKTNYNDLDYYSLKKNNNKININFDEYFKLNTKKNTNKNVYDIVIDAGHGGNDSGATNGKYYEANFTLEYAKALKNKLSSLGYKVKLTRENNKTIKTYGKNSRTGIPYEVHSKYLISIHFNSSEDYISQSGIEVYAPNNINLDLAYSLSKNIKKYTNLDYSTNTAYLIKNGVYIKNLRNIDINNMKNEAKENNFTMYENVDTNTPYLYIIRETGGIITNAYVDGRNKKYGANPYYKSNIGTESYLLELGYINNSKDLKVIINEKNNYVKAIADSLDNYIKNNS